MNKVFLVGNLTRDPELATVGASGASVCRFAIKVIHAENALDQKINILGKLTAEHSQPQSAAKPLPAPRLAAAVTHAQRDCQRQANQKPQKMIPTEQRKACLRRKKLLRREKIFRNDHFPRDSIRHRGRKNQSFYGFSFGKKKKTS